MASSPEQIAWKGGVQSFAQDPGISANGYDNYVYELAVTITASPEEAEAAIDEMMSDIRRTAAGPVAQRSS